MRVCFCGEPLSHLGHPCPSDEAIRRAVGGVPLSATDIFIRYAGLQPNKSLTARLRKRRREVAQTLERLAEEGQIQRGTGEPHPVPVYWR